VAAEDYFFIVGSPRSGTTLLQRMLNGHPQIAVTPETHFGARYFKRRGRFEGGSDAVSRATAREAFLDHYCASKDFASLGVETSSFREAAALRPDEPWWPLRAAMDAYGRKHGKPCVGEKTPSHSLYVEPLARAFPTARFIMLWRDARAMAASLEKAGWSTRNAMEAAEIWRRYSKALRRARSRLPGRCLEVRYESLVSETEAELARICTFLDVPYDSGLLDYPERVDRPIKSVRDTGLTALPPQRDRIDAWRSTMTKEQIRRVEAVCGEEMIRMGYSPDSSRLARWVVAARIGPPIWRRRIAKRVKNRSFRRPQTPLGDG
jgi:hypothetical protein